MPGNTFGELFRVTTAGVSHGPGYARHHRRLPARPAAERRRSAARPAPPPAGPVEDRHPAQGRGPAGNLVRRLRGHDRRHLHRHPVPQHRPAQPAITATSRTNTAPATPISPSTPSTACATTAAAAAPAPARPSAGSPPGPSPRNCSPSTGIRVLGYVKQVGDVVADIPDPTAVTLEQVEATPVRCPDPAKPPRR